ncbi:MAG: Lipoprotein, NLP/P60 family [uncultured Sulfurovum sp.]|uniref:Lipoprotein, NLP/P60 family n=1 Tax=uncultured Sulfurovum sp. TaxID=269237 RepID=A0A6S6STU3_9BACT|nr:MAG: Lipoprotein, NLP/P60 family [uncultured Sulfurovum sp.]
MITIVSALLLTSCQDVGDNKPLLSNSKKKQPIIIVNRNRHLNIPEFWMDRIENSDKVIMNQKEIESFNKNTAHTKHTLNFFKEINKAYGSSWVRKSILGNYEGIKSSVRYFEDGNKITQMFYANVKEILNLDGILNKSVKTRYALTTAYANQKIIPTGLSLLKKKDQIHFDRNQNSALDLATPVAILHTSDDGLWHYGIGPTSSGWIRSENLAFGEREEILNYINSKSFVITTAAKTALSIGGKYHDYMRMGVRLPSILKLDDMTMVMIPTADDNGNLVLSNATVKTADVHKGYLAYTPKNILTQAFKFLHAPYGWGGMYGEQDCSKFLQEIYATVGVKLPRNSMSQSNVSEAKLELSGLSRTSKQTFLRTTAMVGGSIIHLKGHIFLYLGEYKGESYIIHTVWGASSRHYALGRTAVTSLNFNDYMGKIDRLTNITLE